MDELDLNSLGPKCEKHPVFPAKVNTEFVEILSRQHVRMVVWERGAGRTLACGTGACATVVAGKCSFALVTQSSEEAAPHCTTAHSVCTVLLVHARAYSKGSTQKLLGLLVEGHGHNTHSYGTGSTQK